MGLSLGATDFLLIWAGALHLSGETGLPLVWLSFPSPGDPQVSECQLLRVVVGREQWMGRG